MVSPIPGAIKPSEKEMITTAVTGTSAILEAAQAHKVKRLVVTLAGGTIIGGVWKKDQGDNHYSERDFAPPEGADAYFRARSLRRR